MMGTNARSIAIPIALLALVAAQPASADYLYSAISESQSAKPYVLLITDTSGSMAEQDSLESPEGCCRGMECYDTCYVWGFPYPCRNDRPACDQPISRITAAKRVLRELIPSLDQDVILGLTTYGDVVHNNGHKNGSYADKCEVALDDPGQCCRLPANPDRKSVV